MEEIGDARIYLVVKPAMIQDPGTGKTLTFGPHEEPTGFNVQSVALIPGWIRYTYECVTYWSPTDSVSRIEVY